jgi:hypothetical protein
MLSVSIKKEELGYLRLLIDLAKLQYENKIKDSKQDAVSAGKIKPVT